MEVVHARRSTRPSRYAPLRINIFGALDQPLLSCRAGSGMWDQTEGWRRGQQASRERGSDKRLIGSRRESLPLGSGFRRPPSNDREM
jgi:hypothetical protein